jgi:hypothetical protein
MSLIHSLGNEGQDNNKSTFLLPLAAQLAGKQNYSEKSARKL